MITPSGPSGRYDTSAGICLEEPGRPDSSGSEALFTDADETLARQHRRLAERFRELEGRADYFNDRASGAIRKMADWISGAGDRQEKFKQSLERALSHLEGARLARQKGHWVQAHTALQNARMHLDIAGDFWKDYIRATSGGAVSIVRGLRVVRNTSAGFVAAGASALTLGAGTAMAGALAASAGAHAGFFSLSFDEKEYAAPPEIITLEIVDPDEQEGRRSSAPAERSAESVGDLPEEAPPAETGSAYRRPRKSAPIRSEENRKSGGRAEAKEASAEIPASVSHGLPEKEIPPDEPLPLGKLYPSRATLEEIVRESPDVRPNRPRVTVQDPTGVYRRYEDGGTLVRNPEAGIHRVSQEVAVDDQITVDKYGNVYGIEEEIGRQGRTDFLGEVDVALLERNARKLASLCDIYRDPAANPGFFSSLNIFVDSSGSMGANFYVAPATTCAYQAALSALNNRTMVRVFNFSLFTHSTEKTRNKERIAKLIARYEGSDTLLPTGQLEPLKEEKARNDIIIISDGYIQNYEAALPYFWGLLKSNPRNRGYFVVVGKERVDDPGYQHRQKCIREFINIGFTPLTHRG